MNKRILYKMTKVVTPGLWSEIIVSRTEIRCLGGFPRKVIVSLHNDLINTMHDVI